MLIQDGGPKILSTNLLYTEPRRRHYLPLPTRHPPHRCKRPWSAHARSMGSSSGTKQRSMEWSLVHWPVAVASIGNHCACVVPSIANSPLSPPHPPQPPTCPFPPASSTLPFSPPWSALPAMSGAYLRTASCRRTFSKSLSTSRRTVEEEK